MHEQGGNDTDGQKHFQRLPFIDVDCTMAMFTVVVESVSCTSLQLSSLFLPEDETFLHRSMGRAQQRRQV